MYDQILLPTDGSEHAEGAARYARGLARMFDATVHVISVVDTRKYSSDVGETKPRGREQKAELEQQAKNAVEAVEHIVSDAADVEYTSSVEHGVPYEVIPGLAAEQGLHLIVMGTHGRTGLDRMLVGSVTERVVRTSDVPVLAIPPGGNDEAPPAYESVLIPTDGSSAATDAIDHGVAIAEQFDATVHAVSIVTGGLLSPSELTRDEAEAAVEAVAEDASQRGVDVETHIQEGTPSEVIRDLVTDHQIDLVTMGTHGRSGTTRYVLGSVTEKVIRTSSAPVLSVRTATNS